MIVVKKYTPRTTDVIFKEYVDDQDEDMVDKCFSDVLTYPIVGLEQKDGTVVVYKKGQKLTRPLRNKKIFIDKYFTDAI